MATPDIAYITARSSFVANFKQNWQTSVLRHGIIKCISQQVTPLLYLLHNESILFSAALTPDVDMACSKV